MAFVLTSDITVADPDGQMPILTPAGLVDPEPELGVYFQKLSSLGFDLHASEMSALQAFIRNLKTAGVWDNVVEVYPLIGNSVATAAVKLKYFSSQSMTPMHSLGDSHFEFDGSGRLLGKDVNPTEVRINQPHFLTGLTVGELNDSWMVTTLIGDLRQNPGTNVLGNLWGASQNLGANLRTELTFSASVHVMRIENRSNAFAAQLNLGSGWYANGIYQGRARGPSLDFFVNDTHRLNISAVNRGSGGEKRELALFALNPFGSDDITGQFQGKVRFVVISKGIDDAEQKALFEEVDKVTRALGRAFD